MERKAAQGLWKGSKRPYGYRVDKTTQTLVVDEAEAVVVRMIFDLYSCRPHRHRHLRPRPAVLDARGESHAHRAANSSDYLLTGRLRGPRCGRAMIGTRATGRSRSYRYYTCFNRARYDSDKCASPVSTPTQSMLPFWKLGQVLPHSS
ncbi:zinc ribbon domain-containing protein [Nocardia sp. JW2]|uniref:zinc ribbon domain-containing protein n=1 Tax=Nocardia sp. JW2 TaxID=3450738 RepID=UPI003F4368CE